MAHAFWTWETRFIGSRNRILLFQKTAHVKIGPQFEATGQPPPRSAMYHCHSFGVIREERSEIDSAIERKKLTANL